MSTPFKLVRVAALKTPADFQKHLENLGVHIPLDEKIFTGTDSPLNHPVAG